MILIRGLVFTLLIGFFWSEAQSQSKARPCTWDQELFGATASASCRAKLLKRITNDQDRMRIEQSLRKWKMAPESLVTMSPVGLEVRHSGRKTLSAVWVSSSPTIIWMNGKLHVSDSKSKSVTRQIQDLLKNAPKKFSQLDLLINPSIAAEAALTDEDYLNLYHTWGTAADLVASDNARLNQKMDTSLPDRPLGFWGWPYSREISCEGKKLNSSSFEYSATRNSKPVTFVIQPKTRTQHMITGALPAPKKLRYTLQTEEFQGQPCVDAQSTSVLRACDNLLAEYFKANAASKSKYSGYRTGTLNDLCAGFEEKAEADKCRNFLNARAPRVRMVYAAKDYYHPPKLEICDDDACTNPRLTDFDKLISEMKPGSTEEDSSALEYHLRNQVFSAMVLGDCCDDGVCRDKVVSRFNLKLTPQTKSSKSVN